MTEIRFYHLERQTQAQILPIILGKALERGNRVVVKASNEAERERLNNDLWSASPDSFLPHGSAKNGKASMQPIWLTEKDENPNEADVLILCQGASSEMQGEFNLCCEMLNGHDQEAISAARAGWKAYKAKGFDVTYWQQNDAGAWSNKA